MTRLRLLLLAAPLLLAACTGGGAVPASPSGEPAMTDGPAMTDAAAMSEAPAMTDGPAMTEAPMASDEPMASHDGGTGANPAADALAGKAWATETLTDVATGETFTIADLAGKPVFIEAMAIWCSNCRAQQARFTEALAELPDGAAEYVVLTVDPAETAGELARYQAERGFTGRYAVAGKALSKALEAEFGANVLNPPSVPLVFITPSGDVEFTTGAESVEEIRAKVAG